MVVTILGTGSVGKTLAENLISKNHSVILGTRDPDETLNKKGMLEWHNKNNKVALKPFDEAAKQGEIIINALNGGITLSVFKSINEENLKNKIIIDLSNPLDFSKGFPPTLIDGLNNSSSLGESIQNLLPNAKVVKTLNTMWGGLMLSPTIINGGNHMNFICGNDKTAKEEVIKLLAEFTWTKENVLDLGDITNSRGTEAYLLLWTRVYAATNSGAFNLQFVK